MDRSCNNRLYRNQNLVEKKKKKVRSILFLRREFLIIEFRDNTI